MGALAYKTILLYIRRNRMNTNDLFRHAIGFDRLLNMFEGENIKPNGYPPYNIEILDDNHYVISMAVAGFKQNEIDITLHQGELTVEGQKVTHVNEKRQFVHRGIAERNFKQKFQLSDYVQVKGAKFEDGILHISLLKEVPEALKPQKIKIMNPES
jgi:molecular chaperone IbpA